MQPLSVFSPFHLDGDDAPDFNSYGAVFLAEGDSWFTLGTLNPAKNSNLLFEMEFPQRCAAVNCAHPGDTLRRMVQMNRDPLFVQLLAGARARAWSGLLLSAGGNDLIDAAQVPPAVDGQPVPLAQRLLRTPAEWGPPADGAARFLSDAGWQAFCDYLRANVVAMLALRDKGPAAGCPVFVHGYAVPTPRPSGAGFGFGPWLHPAMETYQVPAAERRAVAAELIGRLARLYTTLTAEPALPGLHFFDSTGVAVDPAAPDATGESGDWVNEIHLTWRGYEKVARPWSAQIAAVLSL
jgi:hypothetical protein